MSTIDRWPQAQSTIPIPISDAEATQLAQEVLNGRMLEQDVRWALAAEIIRSKIACQEAYHRGGTKRVVQELCERLEELLTSTIVNVDRKPVAGDENKPGLRLEMLADGTSLHGWARRFCRASSGWSRRTIQRKDVRLVPLPETDDVMLKVGGHRDQEEQAEAGRMEVYASFFAARSKNLRQAGLVHLKAKVLREVFRFPELPRLVDLPERVQLFAALEKGEESRAAAREAAQRMAPVCWADWSDADRDRLETMDPKVACALAEAALTPTPPPQTKAVAIVREILDELVGDHARRLMKAWTASVTELSKSEYACDLGESPKLKAIEKRREEQRNFEAVAAAVIRSGITVMGETPEEVSAFISAGMTRAEAALSTAA